MKTRLHGQSIAEYAILVTAVVIAFVVSSTYLRRGLQARLYGASLVGMPAGSQPPQYEPYYLLSLGKLRSSKYGLYNVSPTNVSGSSYTRAVGYCDAVCPSQTERGSP